MTDIIVINPYDFSCNEKMNLCIKKLSHYDKIIIRKDNPEFGHKKKIFLHHDHDHDLSFKDFCKEAVNTIHNFNLVYILVKAEDIKKLIDLGKKENWDKLSFLIKYLPQ